MGHPSPSPTPHSLSLAEFVLRRNGVPLGDTESLKNMFSHAFGAGTFAGFWHYWNPIWGYALGKYVYAPLQSLAPSWLALLLTFIFSGGLHDLVIMAIRREPALIFIPWFFLLGVGVILGKAVNFDFSSYPWSVRAGINFSYLVTCFVLMQFTKQLVGFS